MMLMSRVLALTVLLAAMLPAPGPVTAGPAPSLFPLVVGATWTRINEDGETSTSRVVGPKTVGTRQCMVIERKATEQGRERIFRTCFLATATEVLVLETTTPRGSQTVLNPPRPALKLPPRAGQTWSWSPADSAFELKITEKWIGEETIKVRAGTFKAWKLQTVTTGEDSEITALTWYAPGVGVVRTERKGYRGDRQISGWNELVSYKIP
jgi:hypothetical protein